MTGPLRLAIKYIAYNRVKSLILISALFLTALLPIAIKLLLWQFNDQLLRRADSTPIVIGAAGNDLDLVLGTLYFKHQTLGPIPYSELQRIEHQEGIEAIPISSRFSARSFPMVGTSVDYFRFRNLSFASGTPFAMLGDCVIGAEVAQRLQLGVGDFILSDRENVVDIAGHYPLKMQIVGVLNRSHTADDNAVFVDVKTNWVIEGLGHGHQDLAKESAEGGLLLSRTDKKIVASGAVIPYNQITDSNRDSFHFHGDIAQFPLTAVIAIGENTEAETILEGQYDRLIRPEYQFARPGKVLRELMSLVFQAQRFFDANAMLIAIATLLLMILVVLLSLKLRKPEMETMFRMGCRRRTIVLLQFWELALICGVSAVLVALAVWGIASFSDTIIESLLYHSAR